MRSNASWLMVVGDLCLVGGGAILLTKPKTATIQNNQGDILRLLAGSLAVAGLGMLIAGIAQNAQFSRNRNSSVKTDAL